MRPDFHLYILILVRTHLQDGCANVCICAFQTNRHMKKYCDKTRLNARDRILGVAQFPFTRSAHCVAHHLLSAGSSLQTTQSKHETMTDLWPQYPE